jgi:hypothetical protein
MSDHREEDASRRHRPAGRAGGRIGLQLGLLGGLLALSACAGDSSMSQQDLSLACEMHKCDCASDSSSFDPGVPVQWQLDGSASCKKGYHLRMLDLPPSSKMVT